MNYIQGKTLGVVKRSGFGIGCEGTIKIVSYENGTFEILGLEHDQFLTGSELRKFGELIIKHAPKKRVKR